MSNLSTLRVAIASDQAISRRGLSSLVMAAREIEIVGQAENATETLQLCELTRPSLLLIDLHCSLEKIIDLVKNINHRWNEICAVLMVDAHQEAMLHELTGESTPCYFTRDISEDELVEALQQLKDEKIPIVEHDSIPQRISTFQTAEPILHLDRNAMPPALAAELDMAGRIQAGFLPEKSPSIPGWEIVARLTAARETSGDFYDFIPLTDNKLGIVVADVADKGMGAALFMALANTLIRNYAGRYPTLPGLTLDAVNERLLSDTRGNMFLTVFFGVLETHTGRLRYANGGHPPPLLIKSSGRNKTIERLTSTGMALGVEEKFHWTQKLTQMSEGDILLLYTDGITEAQNSQGVFFSEERLSQLLRRFSGHTAMDVQKAVLAEVQTYTGISARQDDIALIVVRRVAHPTIRPPGPPHSRITV